MTYLFLTRVRYVCVVRGCYNSRIMRRLHPDHAYMLYAVLHYNITVYNTY